MKKKNIFLLVVLCTAMLMTACGSETVTESSVEKELIETAVMNYFKADSPDYEIDTEHGEYWEVVPGDNGEIKVIHRSYTGAFNYYYVDPATGETYVTEFVPGIIDEEQKTGETFNVNDYMN